jgi:DNA invertase Pin-like site-specific DNA recombinase
MKTNMKKYIAYYRVSTRKQGDSGLGLDAQKRMVQGHVRNDVILEEFTEVESGTIKGKRPILQRAIQRCQDEGATLVIAKIDRLSRNVHFVSSLYQSGVDFVCCDMPHANKLTIHLFAAVAEHEADIISERNKAAAQSIKKIIERDGFYLSKAGNRITKLGGCENPNTTPANKAWKEKARNNRNKNVARPFAQELRRQGMGYCTIAMRLNEAGYKTSKGKFYYKTSVQRLLEEK